MAQRHTKRDESGLGLLAMPEKVHLNRSGEEEEEPKKIPEAVTGLTN